MLFGRARAALYALVEVLRDAHELPVAIPSNICPSVVAAIHAAKARLILAEISAETGLPNDAAMAAIVRDSSQRGIVMPVHLYGFVQDYPLTLRAARDRGWFVLENDTSASKLQSTDDPPFPVFGDAVLLSFGAGKVLDAGGGGAILVRDNRLADELAAKAQSMPPLDARADDVEEYLTKLRRTLRAGIPGGPALAGRWEHFMDQEILTVRHAFPSPLCGAVHSVLDNYSGSIAKRCKRLMLWRRHLANVGMGLRLPSAEQPAPWRLIGCLDKGRDDLVEFLRAKGVDAGTNYPPLTDFYPRLLAGQQSPSAEKWGHSVFNLWLTPDYDSARITQVCEWVVGHLAAREQPRRERANSP